ncbi:MAG TPA: TetR/AcrR family transcriptional regulator [Sphingobium sp.]|nr:TetR/AcrR family transcriptional regulator [Sphingobium sp.]
MTGLDTPGLSRREARRRDRRDAIMQVALRSFLEKGYAATTMSEIAATLGGSKGTLWSYFPSKDDLFAAVLRHAMDAYHAGLMQILDAPGELKPTLHRFATDLLRRVTSPEALALHQLVVTEAARFPKMGAIFFEIAPKHTRALLADYLTAAMARGQLRDADAPLAARTLIMLTLSGCHQKVMWGLLTERSDAQIRQDVDFAVDCFLRIYAPER